MRQFLDDNAPPICALSILLILTACDGDGLTEQKWR